MGCARSKKEVDDPLANGDGSGSGQPLTTREIEERVDAPPQSETVQIAGCSLRYAYVSQRGFYPDDREKANQDAYGVATHYGGDANKALFTVYDGHGKEGDLCAAFCKDTLPGVLSQELRESRTVEDGLKRAFNRTNEQLHRNRNVDDALSGTTAVALYLEGRDMWVANVGDSRAIVVQEHEGNLVARPLSSDQTPYRKDERERVKAAGARVMSMDQIEGLEPIHENWGDVDLGVELDEGGDPPRIWSPFGEYPGTAFTRSMGDVIAEELGVTADPEIIRRRIHPHDKFLVIASDGVFEFLTNQSVADMVSMYPDPLDACKKVVQESYDLWLQYEVRTDDITIICIYIEGMEAEKTGSPKAKEADLDNIALQGLRPVRKETSWHRKRQLIMSNEPVGWRKPLRLEGTKEESYTTEDHVVPKSAEERACILQAIKTNFLFEHTTDKQNKVLVDAMRKRKVKAGEWVIRQGDKGDCFFIIDKGTFEVRVNPNPGTTGVITDEKDAGQTVHVYEPTDTSKPCFGHLALMYSKPRSASVFAKTNGSLWELDRPVFQHVLLKKSRRDVAHTLRQVGVLQTLTLLQVHQLCDVLTEVGYEAGQTIITQGEVGDTFFILKEGRALVTQNGGKSGREVKRLRHMEEYSFFGERALLTREPRSANVIAETKVRCLVLSQQAFEKQLGPLSALIDKERIKREDRGGVPMLQDLQLLGEIAKDDLGQINACRLPQRSTPFTLRTMWKSDVVAEQQRTLVLKSSEMLKHIAEAPTMRLGCVAVPPLVSTYNMEASLHVLHQVSAVCTLSSLMEMKTVVPQDMVRHLTACLVLGLEALHSCDVLYRALSPELVFLDSRGYAVLMEYRMSRLGTTDAFTICGTPEYLAPEQVRHQEHSKAVDFWGLGVLIYELSYGTSPFQADSEMTIYNKISSHRAGMLEIPTSFAPAMGDFIDRLLHHDPQERLGSKADDITAIKTHQWFAGFDWGGVQAGECYNQELKQLAHAKAQKLAGQEGELPDGGKGYSDDQSIWQRF
ncbi:unnamed protein product [Ectocarpus sp. 12 AP-2014]